MDSSFSPHIVLVLSLALTFFSIHSHAARADQSLVKKICNATPYPSLCMSTVNAGPPPKDAKDMAKTIVNTATDKNKLTLKYLLSQPVDVDPSWDLVVITCRQDYMKSNAALGKAKKIDSNVSEEVKEAMSDLAACREKFTVESGPKDLPHKQELIEHLLSVAMKIFTFM